MAIITRIVAAATLASIVFADIAGASAAENYAIAAQRARAHNAHHERAANVNAAGRSERKQRRGVEKRCKASTTSVAPTTSHTSTVPTSTHKAAVTTTTTHKAVVVSTHKTTSTEKAVETSSPGSSTGNKKYFAWGGSNSQLSLLTGNSLAGIYNWGPSPPKVDGLISVCTLWGEKSLSTFRSNREKYTHLMGMNEVNLDAQADMSISETISMWNAEIRPYGKGRTLYAPSVTTAASGMTYLQGFFDGCGTISSISDSHCGVDVLQAHVYGKDPQGLIDYVTKLHTTFYNLPVIISEFACQSFVSVAGGEDCTASEATTYVQTVTKWAMETDWIVGVAPFGFMDDLGNVNQVNAMINGNSVTSLGKWFLNY